MIKAPNFSRLIQLGNLRDIFLTIFFFSSLLMNLFVTFLNVDIYHEGDKFPSVIVMSDGGMIFRDVNNIYGFLVTVLQFPFVSIFGEYLLVSRLVGFVLKIAIIIVFALLLKKVSGLRISVFITSAWLVMTPSWTNLNVTRFTNGFSWPTHYGLFFVLSSILVLTYIVKDSKFASLKYSMSGFLMAVAWSARLEYIAAWSLIALILFVSSLRRDIVFRDFFAWLFGSICFFVGSLSWLFYNGAIQDWFTQTVLVWISDPPAQPKMTASWIFMNAFSFVAIATLGCIAYGLIYYFGTKSFFGYFFSSLIIVALISAGVSLKNFEFSDRNIGAWLFEISNRGLLSFVNIYFAVGLFLSIKVLIRFFFKINEKQYPTYVVLLSGINLSLLAMLHIVNADYIHMFILPYIIVTLSFVKNFETIPNFDSQKMQSVLVASVILFSSLSFVSFVRSAAKPIYPYQSQILSGLFDQDLKRRDSIDTTFSTVAKFSKNGIWTFCISGLPVVSSGDFRSNDKWLWNLQPEAWMVERWFEVKENDYLYVCSLSKGEQDILERNLEIGLLQKTIDGDGFTIYRALGKLQ